MPRKTRSASDPRVNLAVKPELFEYAKVMAAIKGESITDFLNKLIAADMERNAEVYQEAKALQEKLK